MSATTDAAPQGRATAPARAESLTPAGPVDATDRPIPFWPEGVLAAAAGITLMVIGLRHRTWLQRKAREAQRAAQEFQRHGGIEDLTQMARDAAELVKGATGGRS